MGRSTLTTVLPVAGLLLIAGLIASAAALSAGHSDPHNSAETAFLGLLAGVVLCGVAFVDRRPHWILSSATLLTVVALWALPTGEVRGASISLILATAVALAASNRFSIRDSGGPAATFVALAISVQGLLRPELWLAPNWSLAFISNAVLLPAIAGLAVAELVRDRNPGLACGAGVVVAFQAGVTPEIALVLTLFAVIRTATARSREATVWIVAGLVILATHLPELSQLFVSGSGWTDRSGGLAWLVLFVPAVLRPAPGRFAHVAGAVVFAAVAITVLPVHVALAIPLLVLYGSVDWHSSAGRLQTTWSAAVLLGSTLTAGYPWLSTRPVEKALSLLNLESSWRHALAVATILWGIVALGRLLARSRSEPLPATLYGRVAMIVIGVGLLVGNLPSYRGFVEDPFILSKSAPSRKLPAQGSIGELFLDSYVSNARAVAPGTPVARVIIEGSDGAQHPQIVRAGIESGEWAARRQGSSPGTPEHWISWLAPDGPYFAQRYRARWHLQVPVEASAIRVERVEGIPQEVELAVFQIGARR